MPAAASPRQTGLKRLAGALAFVCLVLALLALEQRQTVAAWHALRDDAVPAAGRMVDWAAGGARDGVTGLKTAAGDAGPRAATTRDQVLAGEFAPADAATRDAVGGVAFVAATLRFDSGETLHTRPLRIASGRDAFVHGETFAARFGAPDDAQVELRRVIPASGVRVAPPSPLCGGQPAGALALLHRRDRIDVILFRERTIIGPDAAAAAVCGVWSFRER